jgi:hypothetical protein
MSLSLRRMKDAVFEAKITSIAFLEQYIWKDTFGMERMGDKREEILLDLDEMGRHESELALDEDLRVNV